MASGTEIVAGTQPLPELADAANREHAAVVEAFQGAAGHAWLAGRALLDAKAQVAHGEWLPWVEKNFADSDRCARQYMRIAEAYPNRQGLADLSITKAIAAIARVAEPATSDAHEYTACPACGHKIRADLPLKGGTG